VEIESAPERLRGLPSWLLNQAALAANRIVGDGLAAVGAHRSHYAVLSALDEFGPASQAALGRRCGIDRSDMVALINALSRDGLVGRRPDPADRRRNVVTITAGGRRRLRSLETAVARLQDAMLAPLSAPERRQLVGLLRRVVEHHGAT
jgi:MarR family transcriptional regulator, lower aerobic nicotinate degradation pathway regulator